MNEISQQVEALFENKEIDLFIGYEQGTRRPRPFFVSNLEDTHKLIFDETCTGNLAVYLTRKDLVGGKKTGIAASYYALKNIIQLFNENQLKEENFRVIVLTEKGDMKLLRSKNEIKQFLQITLPPEKPNEDEWVRKIDAMTTSERWTFWINELSKCFKCYACRSACPMCYCTKCIIEVNRPQWIQPWASTLSNMEWQINRVMHIAGRCSDCGSCGAACPLGIPVHLLNHKIIKLVNENFGASTGKGNVLSTFQPNDKENFIG
jgi:ferredoxin